MTKILLVGQVYAVARKSFEDTETIYAQFLNKKDDGGAEIQKVKMTDKEDILLIKEGVNVKIPVKISSFNNQLYFTQVDSIVK